MKIAVLGASGMLGARVVEEFTKAGHEITPITRGDVDLKFQENVKHMMSAQPDWVVNCAGVVKSLEKEQPVQMALVNAAMPHWLEEFNLKTRILHVSTDCVFRGNVGNYSEADQPDPVDLYGATKLAGEITGPYSTTVRTSFIGWENCTERGLVEWFVRQPSWSGYTKAVWSGLSAREVARALVRVIAKPWPKPLYHLSGQHISKYELLRLLHAALKLDGAVVGVDEPVIDRSLNGTLFADDFGYRAPTWEEMAEELARERPT